MELCKTAFPDEYNNLQINMATIDYNLPMNIKNTIYKMCIQNLLGYSSNKHKNKIIDVVLGNEPGSIDFLMEDIHKDSNLTKLTMLQEDDVLPNALLRLDEKW